MIKIKNANENNLKNISVNIPKNKITSIIGVSGSGKSSLIYGVLANEAKRREKIDSGNADCLDYAVRPKFESIENLPYAVVLKQRGLQQSISSTLATATQLHELLREEFASYGEIVGESGDIIKQPKREEIELFIEQFYPEEKFEKFAVLSFQKYIDGEKELKNLRDKGIKEVVVISSYDNKERVRKLSSVKELNAKYHHTILVPTANFEELETLAVESFLVRNSKLSLNFGYDYPDLKTGKIYQKKSAQLLSFNSIDEFSGKCKECNGKGLVENIDIENLINYKKINELFLNLEENGKGCYKYIGLCQDTLKKKFKEEKIDLNKTFHELEASQQKIVLDFISEKILKHKGKPSIGKFVKTDKCSVCGGTRLNYKANAIKLYGKSISDTLNFSVEELYDFFKDKKIHHKKIINILEALQKATLGYLTLNRTTDTLSGGELQRLKFALELVNEYKNLLYILDEPSVGLHPYNNAEMIALIKNIRDKGNTVVISEHNREYIDASDFIIELGYGSGDAGGEIVFTGEKKEENKNEFLREKRKFNMENSLKLFGVNANNIKNEDFIIPLNCLVVVSGVSGSGKSSLIHKVLVPTLKQYLSDRSHNKSLVKNIEGFEQISSIVELTQSQIGVNSRSIVATYLNVFDEIRELFSSETFFDKSYFSFNSTGACETCKGLGEVNNLICTSCLGERYKPEVLDIRYRDKNISELLKTPISNLENFFQNKKVSFTIDTLKKLGLSHLSLGRSTPTLSGGEGQRLKFAKSLIEGFNKIKKGSFLFILDEPTSGLNSKDIIKIYDIFDEVISAKNSVIVIEHNQNIINNSDYVIDMGVGSGENGGENIFSGKFEDLLDNRNSLTAKALRGENRFSENLEIAQNLKEKTFTNSSSPKCNSFYLREEHFQIEDKFSKKYQVTTDNKNHKFFKTADELFFFAKNIKEKKILFNPYVTELFKYKKVPLSIKKERLKNLKKLGFNIKTKDYEVDCWSFRVETNNLEQAYNSGSGWITIESNSERYELFTRLVSIKDKILGSPQINEKSFNLYLNSCVYCSGTGEKEIYDIDLIIADKSKSVLDEGFFHSNIKLKLKSIISIFAKEQLFDFAKPFNKLSKEEKDIFLFGFKEYKFLKPNGKASTLGDYVEWKGINFYIYENLNKISIRNKIKESQRTQVCPFCQTGFNKEVEYYKFGNKTILEFVEKNK
jgi:excinuclease ABC subunit A